MPAIKGQVISERETPIGGTTVELINRTGDIVDQIRVDDEGRFALHVARGTWRLRAYDPQGQRGETSVTIQEDDAPAQVRLA